MYFGQTFFASFRLSQRKLTPIFLFPLLALALAGGLLAGRPVFANVDLLYFRAESSTDTITLVWETETELDNLGFHLWRSQTGNQADAVRINPTLIPSQVGGQPIGALYEYPDTNVQAQVTYSYWLESVDLNNTSQFHGPVQASLGGGSTINTPDPGGSNPPEPTRTPAPPTATTAAANPSTPAGSQPTAASSNPTATTASLSASPTAALPTATSSGFTSNSAPPASTQPAVDSQPADAVEPAGDDPADSGENLPEAAAVTPIGAVDATAIASNDSAPATQPTATFIAGQELSAVGEQDTTNPNDEANSAGRHQSEGNRRQTVALGALVTGLLLTAGGGFALWYMNRHKTNSL